ncbi:hypothetical protein BJX99DRAFT_236649 [Aspergillus californicus]
MDTEMDINSPPLTPSPSNSFIPLNSPEGSAMDEDMQKKIKQEVNDEEESSISHIKAAAEDANTNADADADGDMAMDETKSKHKAKPKAKARATPKTTPKTTPAKAQAPAAATSSSNPITPSKETPSNPRKRGRKPNTNTDTPSKKFQIATDDGDEETPTKGAGGTPARATLAKISTSLATATPEDKMIIALRDEDKLAWTEITKVFFAKTGIQVGGSTLRMRYNTMKANFVSISEEDEARLTTLKKEIEDKFETEKWTRIADAIVANGGAKYPGTALQKKFKELCKGSSSSESTSSGGTLFLSATSVGAAGGSNGPKEEEA